MNRFVHRVRVMPKPVVRFPKEDFREVDQGGRPLEVLISFYEWKYPEKTAATLFFICICIAISVFTSAGFALKVVMMILTCK
jgi:hypothetical protein